MMAASVYRHAEAVKELLDGGADANEVDRYKHVPVIFMAAMEGTTDVVRELIAHGANVNALSGHGQTALIAAASKGKADIVELLLKSGADRHIRDEDGRTAFDFAAATRQRQVHDVALRWEVFDDELGTVARTVPGSSLRTGVISSGRW